MLTPPPAAVLRKRERARRARRFQALEVFVLELFSQATEDDDRHALDVLRLQL